jgi:hypothetical protein
MTRTPRVAARIGRKVRTASGSELDVSKRENKDELNISVPNIVSWSERLILTYYRPKW